MSRPPRVLTVCRFKFNPLDPFDVTAVEQMFFLCRASLSHAKLGTYVEQYQGMTTLTRSVAFGSCVAATYYASWIISSVLAHVAQGGHTVWPMLTLAVAIVFADGVTRGASAGAVPAAEDRSFATGCILCFRLRRNHGGQAIARYQRV